MVRVGLSFSWKPNKVVKIVKAKVLEFLHSSNGDMWLGHFVKIWHLSPMKIYLHILKTAATITSWNALKFLPRREIASPVSIPPLSGTLTLGWWAVHMEDRSVCECIPMKSTSFKTLNGLAWRFLAHGLTNSVLPHLWLELSFSVAGAVSKAISNNFQRGLEFCMDASCAGGCYPLCLEEQAGNSYIGIHHQFSCFIFIDAQYEVHYACSCNIHLWFRVGRL